MNFIKETPENIKELVKKANCTSSWKVRMEALNILKKYDCQQSRDVIVRLALHDKVWEVKEAAFRVAQSMNITKKGKPIFLGKKDIGFKYKDFEKVFNRIKREKKMEEFDLELFKETFKVLNPEMYDVMMYEKNKKFDEWIENIFRNLKSIK